MFKLIAGIMLLIVAIALGFYVGLWWGFVGGIVLAIEGVTASPINAVWVAVGIARFTFAFILGYGTAIFTSIIPLLLIGKGFDDLVKQKTLVKQ